MLGHWSGCSGNLAGVALFVFVSIFSLILTSFLLILAAYLQIVSAVKIIIIFFCQKQSISCNLRLALLSGPSNQTPLDQMTKRCLRPLPSGSKIATVHIFANFTKSLPAIKTKGIQCNQMELYKKNAKACNLMSVPKVLV